MRDPHTARGTSGIRHAGRPHGRARGSPGVRAGVGQGSGGRPRDEPGGQAGQAPAHEEPAQARGQDEDHRADGTEHKGRRRTLTPVLRTGVPPGSPPSRFVSACLHACALGGLSHPRRALVPTPGPRSGPPPCPGSVPGSRLATALVWSGWEAVWTLMPGRSAQVGAPRSADRGRRCRRRGRCLARADDGKFSDPDGRAGADRPAQRTGRAGPVR
jgi:hypothetical protein